MIALLGLSVSAQTLTRNDGGWLIVPSPLTFPVSTTAASQTVAVNLPADTLRGQKVAIKFSLKGIGVSQRPQSWNGIKVMIKIETAGEPCWPQFTLPQGTFDWRIFGGNFSIPESATAPSMTTIRLVPFRH